MRSDGVVVCDAFRWLGEWCDGGMVMWVAVVQWRWDVQCLEVGKTRLNLSKPSKPNQPNPTRPDQFELVLLLFLYRLGGLVVWAGWVGLGYRLTHEN